MLQTLSEDIAECLAHAAKCELRADQTTDPDAKQWFVDIAARWRRIGETYKYIERVDRFLAKPPSA